MPVSTTTLLILLVVVAVIGAVAVGAVLASRGRRPSDAADREFAPSTEGETRCSSCGMGNMWTDRTCISCGTELPH